MGALIADQKLVTRDIMVMPGGERIMAAARIETGGLQFGSSRDLGGGE